MATNNEQSVSLREINMGQHVRHYLELLWRKKWYLLIAVPFFTIVATVTIVNYHSIRPDLPATIVIGLDNSSTKSGVDDFADIGQKKMEMIRSRKFLSGIAESLSLRLVMKDHLRSSIFDSIRIGADALDGKYQLSVRAAEDTTFRLLFWNEKLGHNAALVAQGPLAELAERTAGGLRLVGTRDFLASPRNVVFSVVDTRTAVDNILKKLTLEIPRRGQDFFTVTLEGHDYPLIADILNTMADEFVRQNFNFRKRRTKEVLDVLQRQLEAASDQLTKSEAVLRSFMAENPTVGLDRGAQQTMASLMALESKGSATDRDLSDARRLRSQYGREQGEAKHQVVQEMLFFLNSREIFSAAVLQDELAQLVQERERLKPNYAPDHPLINENAAKIDRIGNRAHDALNTFIANGSRSISEKQSSVRSLSERLRSLPQKELRLVELQRKREIDSDIYTTILSRYNQARVADAAEMADVFIMDVAVAPLPEPLETPKALLLGLLFGIAVSFGPLVLFDAMDQTARTEHELKRLISFPVLQCIPLIPVRKSTRPRRSHTEENEEALVDPGVDPHLITSDYAPNYINELFRSLRTKLLLGLHHAPHRSIVVTSLNANEGKSLISANVAVTLAQQNLTTVLVDGDLRRGVLQNTFAVRKSPGLSEFVFSAAAIDAESVAQLAQVTHVPNLSLISSGANIPNPSELLSSGRFQELIRLLVRQYDFVILDTPPIGFASDAVVVNGLFSKYVVVAKAGSTNIIDLRERIEEYPYVNEKVLGVVLNRASVDRKLKYYKYSNYYY